MTSKWVSFGCTGLEKRHFYIRENVKNKMTHLLLSNTVFVISWAACKFSQEWVHTRTTLIGYFWTHQNENEPGFFYFKDRNVHLKGRLNHKNSRLFWPNLLWLLLIERCLPWTPSPPPSKSTTRTSPRANNKWHDEVETTFERSLRWSRPNGWGRPAPSGRRSRSGCWSWPSSSAFPDSGGSASIRSSSSLR